MLVDGDVDVDLAVPGVAADAPVLTGGQRLLLLRGLLGGGDGLQLLLVAAQDYNRVNFVAE